MKALIFRDDRFFALKLTIPDLSKESDAFIFRVRWALEEIPTLEKKKKGKFLHRMGIFYFKS